MASPIETRLLEAICAAAAEHRFHIALDDEEFGLPADPDHEPRAQHLVTLERDARVGSYRIDLLLIDAVELAVECDGHDFHDRTKQQAAYDRARDRELLLGGVITIRFTGSEIVHSAERCADEVLRIFAKLNDRAGTEAWMRIQLADLENPPGPRTAL